MFKALRIHASEEGTTTRVEELSKDSLPEGPVTVAVRYSSLNYKDGLAITGQGKIIRGELPFVPGIDLAGEVTESSDPRFQVGDRVVGTGGGLGETRWGGFAELARPDPDYLVKLPNEMSFEEAMAVGTAGFTAMLAVMALDREEVDREMPVLVSGASGGVGSTAVALLAANGYRVVASTGKASARDYLTSLGASHIMDRNELSDGPRRPMESAEWGGAIDTVGGATLSTVISRLGWHGTVAACGNAGGAELNTSVFPFILRGAKIIGIDSNTSPREEREEAWRRLAKELPRKVLSDMYRVVSLKEVPAACADIVRGKLRGRTVISLA